MSTPVEIAPAKGKLGVLLVGLGAVSTTTIAGVFAIRKGLAKPIGSLAEMGTVRLGKRTENRSPLIRDFVPLAELNDIVFGGWDIFDDNCYEAAKHAGVLEEKLLEQVKDELAAVKPMPAVFDRQYVKRLDGPNVKKGKNKKDLADQLVGSLGASLPELARQAFVLRYVQDESYEAVGVALGRTAHQARGLCHSAVVEIRRRLGVRQVHHE